jgi:hypothetical protein
MEAITTMATIMGTTAVTEITTLTMDRTRGRVSNTIVVVAMAIEVLEAAEAADTVGTITTTVKTIKINNQQMI